MIRCTFILTFLLLLASCGATQGLLDIADTESTSAASTNQITIETLADGSGTAIGTTALASSQTLTAHAILRTNAGAYISTVTAAWSATNNIGTFNLATAPSVTFTATTANSGNINATFSGITGTAGLITVSAGAAAKFAPLTPTAALTGADMSVTVQAQDINGNFVNSYSGTVSLTGTGGLYGLGALTLTAGTGSIDISSTTAQTATLSLIDSAGTGFNVSDTVSATFTASTPTSFYFYGPTFTAGVGTTPTFQIHARDTYNNTATTFNNSVTLTASPSLTGSGVINFTNGVGVATISSSEVRSYSMALIDSATTGLSLPASKTYEFTIGPPVKFNILNPTDVGSGVNTEVKVQALNTLNQIVTTYNTSNAVTLVGSGSASGGGPVSFATGVGSLYVSNTSGGAEIVTLSLSDTAATGYDVSSTQDVQFSGSLSMPCSVGGSPFGGGTGTNGDPYTICTVAHLYAISTDLNKEYLITDNLDMAAVTWTPIANFAGKLRGNYKTISNFSYTNASTSAFDAGIFESTTAAAHIENITFNNASFNASSTSDVQHKTGILVGSNAGTITYITLNSGSFIDNSPNNTTRAGALVGENTGTISFIHSKIGVQGRTAGNDANHGVGGVIGYNATGAVVTDVVVATTAITMSNSSSGTNLGGAIGYNDGTVSNVKVTLDYFYADQVAGGVIGKQGSNGVVTNISFTNGHFDIFRSCGGLIGDLRGKITNGTVNISYINPRPSSSAIGGAFYNLVSAEASDIWVTINEFNGPSYGSAGGIAHYLGSGEIMNAHANITTFKATGNIPGGGITGSTGSNAFITKCTATLGTVNFSHATSMFGGISGGIDYYTRVTDNILISGNITAGAYAGGIVGNAGGRNINYDIIRNTVKGGVSLSAATAVGGIVGNFSKNASNSSTIQMRDNVVGSIDNGSRNNVTLNGQGTAKVGGFVGAIDNDTLTMQRNVTINQITAGATNGEAIGEIQQSGSTTTVHSTGSYYASTGAAYGTVGAGTIASGGFTGVSDANLINNHSTNMSELANLYIWKNESNNSPVVRTQGIKNRNLRLEYQLSDKLKTTYIGTDFISITSSSVNTDNLYAVGSSPTYNSTHINGYTSLGIDSTGPGYGIIDGTLGSAGYPMSGSIVFQTSGTGKQHIISHAVHNIAQDYFSIGVNSGEAFLEIDAGGTTLSANTSGKNYADGKPHVISFVFTSATDKKVYFDGELVINHTTSINIPTVPSRVGIGVLYNTANLSSDILDGQIGDIRLYGVIALTDRERNYLECASAEKYGIQIYSNVTCY